MRLRVGTKVSLVSKDKMLPVFETEVTEVNPDTRVIVFRDAPPSYFSPGDKIVRTADLKALQDEDAFVTRLFGGNDA